MHRTKIDPDKLIKLGEQLLTIDEIVDEFEKDGTFDREDDRKLARASRKRQVRTAISKAKGKDGFPVMLSVTKVDANGKEVPKFGQWRLFGKWELKQSVEKLRQKERYIGGFKRALRKFAKEKFPDEQYLFG